MKNSKYLKSVFCAIILMIIGLSIANSGVFAGNFWDLQKESGMGTEDGEIGSVFAGTGASDEDLDVRNLAVTIIKFFLGFLALIAVIIIIAAGFRWMKAGGNDDEVKKAKAQIVAAAIGLVIIIASFAITQFIITMSGQALNNEL